MRIHVTENPGFAPEAEVAESLTIGVGGVETLILVVNTVRVNLVRVSSLQTSKSRK